MDFYEYGAGEAEQWGRVREDTDDVGAAFDFPVEPLQRVGGPDLLPVAGGEPGERQQVLLGGPQHLLDFETSMPGVFAVGDVRQGSPKRVAGSVGEGSVAVRLVHDYLAQMSQQEAANMATHT
jgi:NADPH-dependent glutamate synthase beta subunit-like oxidoreductase